VEVIEPTILEYNDDILYVEYELFSCGFDINESFDAEYESFSFDPIQTNFIFKSHKSAFVEFGNIVTENFDLDQTLAHFDIKRLVEFGPIILPRLLIHNEKISRLMTHLLANFQYACLFDVWAQQFDKLKQALTCAVLTW